MSRKRTWIFVKFLSIFSTIAFLFTAGNIVNAHPSKTILSTQPWMIYVGGFGGPYSAHFIYGGNYFSNRPANQIYSTDTFQQSYSVGGQLGLQYHFQSPYFIGALFSSMVNTNKARLTETIDNSISASNNAATDLYHEFRINNNIDFMLMLGADVTPKVHLYIKGGASHARFSHTLITTLAQSFQFPIPFLQETERYNLWGWAAGVGLTYDINQWFNLFAEYMHYTFSNQVLRSYNNIHPFITGTTEIDRAGARYLINH